MYHISKEYEFAKVLILWLGSTYTTLVFIVFACTNGLALMCRLGKCVKFKTNMKIWGYTILQAHRAVTVEGMAIRISS